MRKNMLFLGYGYTARALAGLLREDGWTLAGTARTAQKAAALADEGITPVLWTANGLDATAVDGADAALISTPPAGDTCPAFAAVSDALASRAGPLRWIGYLSSNGVYGDHDGDWVDEEAALRPSTPRARARIHAEAEWAGFAAAWSLPLAIFRLPGIYGPGRSALDSVREGRAQRVVKKGQVFNRMHVDDIARALSLSLAKPEAGDLFNLADDEPAPPQDVIDYACRLLGVEPPPEVAFEEAPLSDMARSFYADNKRVSNAYAKRALDLRLLYPTYREGLDALFRNGG